MKFVLLFQSWVMHLMTLGFFRPNVRLQPAGAALANTHGSSTNRLPPTPNPNFAPLKRACTSVQQRAAKISTVSLLVVWGLHSVTTLSAQSETQSGPDVNSSSTVTTRRRPRELGIDVGILPAGSFNAITDVEGVTVGHQTLHRGASIRTGVTLIKPHSGNIFKNKVPAAIHVGNGFGKLAGATQVEELGNIETPIALTNTLNVATGVKSLVNYTLASPGNDSIGSVNAIVGETNDGRLNDIRGMHVQESDFLAAIQSAKGGRVEEGCVGAGTGTSCFGFKGGIGTSSRVLPTNLGGHTVGVLVQTNFGGILKINGAPVGRELGKFSFQQFADSKQDGSCMIVIATDAPLSSRNLKRLARRSLFGMARTGSIMSNGSGDYAIAFSTAYTITRQGNDPHLRMMANDKMSPLFLAVAEATEEAIYNSLFAAQTTTGKDGHKVEALPVDQTLKILDKYRLLNLNQRLPSVPKPGRGK